MKVGVGAGDRVGILTGGGDAPGLNAAICGAGRRLARAGVTLLGLRNGWRGLIEDDVVEIDPSCLLDLVTRGGTILGAGSANPFRDEATDVPRVLATVARQRLAAVVAVGGDGTLGSAEKLFRLHRLPVVGVPKTIDNDVPGTDFTFGFVTAVERATAIADLLRTTAQSHGRVFVVECMGRSAGWIAAYTGLACGAEAILVPERPTDLEELYGRLRLLRSAGRQSAIVVAAEGARIHERGRLLSSREQDEYGNWRTGGVAAIVAARIEAELGWEARPLVLGHVQRAGPPQAFDRIFALRLGMRAARLVLEGRFGRMAALTQGEVGDVPLAEAVGRPKILSEHFLDTYEGFYLPS